MFLTLADLSFCKGFVVTGDERVIADANCPDLSCVPIENLFPSASALESSAHGVEHFDDNLGFDTFSTHVATEHSRLFGQRERDDGPVIDLSPTDAEDTDATPAGVPEWIQRSAAMQKALSAPVCRHASNTTDEVRHTTELATELADLVTEDPATEDLVRRVPQPLQPRARRVLARGCGTSPRLLRINRSAKNRSL